MNNKFRLYEEAGVREYWIIEPADKFVLVYVLRDGEFIGLRPVTEQQALNSSILPGLDLDLTALFAE